eukprot:364822-Chlamydomonas_euryale.AAC.6
MGGGRKAWWRVRLWCVGAGVFLSALPGSTPSPPFRAIGVPLVLSSSCGRCCPYDHTFLPGLPRRPARDHARSHI